MPSRRSTENGRGPADEELLSPRLQRALGDVLGGLDGGWSFWLAGLAQLELAIARSRDGDGRFCSYPKGELARFARKLEDGLDLLALAVDVQNLINAEPDDDGDARRRDLVALLGDRLRQVAARGAS